MTGTQSTIRNLCGGMLAVVCGAGLLCGCSVPIPIFEEEITIADNAEIGAGLVDLPAVGLPFQDQELSLGEFCDIPTQDEIIDLAREYGGEIGNLLPDRIILDSVEVEYVEFAAEEGDFNSITEVRAVIEINGQERELSRVADPNGLGMNFQMTPANPPLDLLELLGDGSGCIEGVLTVSGVTPEGDIVFDAVAKLNITARIRII